MATVSLPSRFYADTLPSSETSVYTTPAAQIDVITSITFDNLTAATRTVTMRMAGKFFVKTLDIPPRAVIVLDVKQVLNTAENIQLTADAADSISAFISGVKITQV
jgi:hypothetical protein